MTGAVHLLKRSEGVPRRAQRGRKPRVEQKGKCWLDLSLQYGARSRNVGLSILFISEFEERGVRKITTGITGLCESLFVAPVSNRFAKCKSGLVLAQLFLF